MRIWSIHPKYLDVKGLVALWRETLLAKHVLEGKTKGYKNHPQLSRFKELDEPVDGINEYLVSVYAEATERGYQFNKELIGRDFKAQSIPVTSGQLKFERDHLLNKLKARAHERFLELQNIEYFIPHPMFTAIDGEVASWEK